MSITNGKMSCISHRKTTVEGGEVFSKVKDKFGFAALGMNTRTDGLTRDFNCVGKKMSSYAFSPHIFLYFCTVIGIA